MGKSYKNISDALHDYYLSGREVAGIARASDFHARHMLNKTRIFPRLSEVKLLFGLYSELLETKDENRWIQLGGLLHSYFEPITDDFLLMSAFELNAKAILLRKGYIIHRIESPPGLRREQRDRPIHVRTVRHSKYRSKVCFSPYTIAVFDLLRPAYARHYPMSKDAEIGLREVNGRRNSIHFTIGYAWQVHSCLLAFVDHLNTVIPQHKQTRNRNPN